MKFETLEERPLEAEREREREREREKGMWCAVEEHTALISESKADAAKVSRNSANSDPDRIQ